MNASGRDHHKNPFIAVLDGNSYSVGGSSNYFLMNISVKVPEVVVCFDSVFTNVRLHRYLFYGIKIRPTKIFVGGF